MTGLRGEENVAWVDRGCTYMYLVQKLHGMQNIDKESFP
jgi:hypothetical protein